MKAALVIMAAGMGSRYGGSKQVSGLAGFAKTPTPDSLAILPALGALVQCLVLLITKPDACGTLLAGPAALVLLLNAVF